MSDHELLFELTVKIKALVKTPGDNEKKMDMPIEIARKLIRSIAGDPELLKEYVEVNIIDLLVNGDYFNELMTRELKPKDQNSLLVQHAVKNLSDEEKAYLFKLLFVGKNGSGDTVERADGFFAEMDRLIKDFKLVEVELKPLN